MATKTLISSPSFLTTPLPSLSRPLFRPRKLTATTKIEASFHNIPPLQAFDSVVDFHALVGRAEGLLYTLADAAVVAADSSSAAAGASDAAAQKNGGWFGELNTPSLGFEADLMEGKRIQLQFLLVLISCLAYKLCTSDPILYESFDESFEGRWIVSEKDDYKGVWKHSKSEGHDDYGLLVSEKARKYAIVKELDEPLNLKDGSTVLQFETRLQNGLECGGAYLKYLRPQESGWNPKEFDNEAPYSIMFGPDKCGSTNKVHFILKHKNPKTGEYVEHHLKYPPAIPLDKLSHVYTAVLNSDNELRILLDGEEKKKANFLSSEDFDPPLIPAKTIPDPDDKRPKDWDDRARIPDPNAVKPDDWDEDAPMEIEDEAAEKPEGWLDDEPEEIDDPEAKKPEDWDDEEDGEWEAPKIDNPKCELAPGCGEWKRPMKRNPAYKGKWHAPLIDNPDYKGVWKPQQIPNPDYFEIEKPDFEPLAAIGIEIWTMQDGILFDNILLARDEKVAESYREKTWKPKFEVEKEKEKAEEAASSLSDGLKGIKKKAFDVLYRIADIPFLEAYRSKIIDVIEKGETQPNLTIGILVSVIVIILTIFSRILFGGKKPAAVPKVANEKKKKAPAAKPEKEGSNSEKEDENEKEAAAPPPRLRREMPKVANENKKAPAAKPEKEGSKSEKEDENEKEDTAAARPRRSRRET